MVFVLSTTSALILGIALFRSHGRVTEVADQATQFALSAAGIMTAAAVSAITLATVTWVAARLQSRSVLASLRLGPTQATWHGLVGAVVGLAGVSLACSAIDALLGLSERGSMAAIAHALQRPPPSRLLLAIAFIAIAPAFAEETFFRGLIQTRLTARWGRFRSVVVTALGFGLIHLDLVQGSVAFIAGLFLGWVTERFGGIRPAILAHGVNNAAFVGLAALDSGGDLPKTKQVWAAGIGCVLLAGSVALLQSRFSIRQTSGHAAK